MDVHGTGRNGRQPVRKAAFECMVVAIGLVAEASDFNFVGLTTKTSIQALHLS